MIFMNTQRLVTDRLVLRKANINDLNDIFNNVWKDNRLNKYMLWKVSETIEEAKVRLDKTINFQKDNYGYFICLKDTNEPVGFVVIKEVEPGVYEDGGLCIAVKCQRKGYGKEVIGILKELIFNELKGNRFICSCFEENEPSKKLILSQGFKFFKDSSVIREWDNQLFVVNNYYFDKDMYK